MKTHQIEIALIGAGSRSAYLLQDLTLRLPSHLAPNIKIHLIEKSETFGPGLHVLTQPDELILNTACGIVCMFHPASCSSQAPEDSDKFGPTFYEWCLRENYRKVGFKYIKLNSNENSEPIKPSDFLPRNIGGKYISWCFELICKRIERKGVYLVRHNSEVVDIEPGSRFRIALANKSDFLLADYVIVNTGYVRKLNTLEESQLMERLKKLDGSVKYLNNPLFDFEQIKKISRQDRVAVQGMSLTAFDIIAMLTFGKGGQFVRNATNNSDELEYIPSGEEPQIYLFSRSGVPSSTKPLSTKKVTYKRQYFTAENVLRLRLEKEKLDFELDLFPLIEKDLINAHRMNASEMNISLSEDLNVRELFFQKVDSSSYTNYIKFVQDKVNTEIKDGLAGEQSSLSKATRHTLVEMINVMRTAVYNRGLSGLSHKEFAEKWDSNFTRLLLCLPVERMQQFKALLKAGIIRMDIGLNPDYELDEKENAFVFKAVYGSDVNIVKCNVVMIGLTKCYPPELSDSDLFRSLLKRGMIRAFRNEGFQLGAVDASEEFEAVDAEGQIISNLFYFGLLTDGLVYLNAFVPLAVEPCVIKLETGKLVEILLKRIIQ